MLKNIILTLGAISGALLISSCSSSDRNDDASIPTAPASMAGATFSFNPTVELLDGSNFIYTNTETGSSFQTGIINGTYLYNRDSDSQATITLNGPNIGGQGLNTLDLVLTNFTGTPDSITSFTVSADGQTSIATVDSGTVESAPNTDEGNDGDNGDNGGSGEIPDDPDATPATIDPGFVGTHTLTYFENATPSPYTDGQVVTFEITADGELKFEGKTLTGAFFYRGNEFEVIWFDGTFGYSASGDGSLNEINLARGYNYTSTTDFTFLGQFNDK
ncbi:MAG: hypothetical protein AB8D78_15830 [Akkermansiaceae bacterium]